MKYKLCAHACVCACVCVMHIYDNLSYFFSCSSLWQTTLKLPLVDCYVWEYQLVSFIMCDKAEANSFLRSKYFILISSPSPPQSSVLQTCGFRCLFRMLMPCSLKRDEAARGIDELDYFLSSQQRHSCGFVTIPKTLRCVPEWESLRWLTQRQPTRPQ